MMSAVGDETDKDGERDIEGDVDGGDEGVSDVDGVWLG